MITLAAKQISVESFLRGCADAAIIVPTLFAIVCACGYIGGTIAHYYKTGEWKWWS